MASKLYLSASNTPDISPSFGGAGTAWNKTTSADRRWMMTMPDGSTIASKVSTTQPNSTGSPYTLNRQFVSPPLAAQTILVTGYLRVQIRGNVSSTTSNSSNDSLKCYVIDPTGVIRGVIIDMANPSGTTYSTTLTNRGTASSSSGISFSGFGMTGDLAVLDGDRIVIEVGVQHVSGTSTSITCTQSFGSSASSDMANDNTSTAANNPFVEFSQTLKFGTRFFLPSTGTPAITPAFGTTSTTWNVTSGAFTFPMSLTKDGSTLTSFTSAAGTLSPQLILLGQFISAPLAAQTILAVGFANMQIRGNMSSVTSASGVLVWTLKVMASNGTTVRGVLFDSTPNSQSNYTTTLTNRGTRGFLYSYSSYGGVDISVSAGDYLVLELGWAYLTGSGSKTGTMSFGSSSGVDLPPDNTTTTANDPWFEMSQVIAFQQSGSIASNAIVSVTASATLTQVRAIASNTTVNVVASGSLTNPYPIASNATNTVVAAATLIQAFAMQSASTVSVVGSAALSEPFYKTGNGNVAVVASASLSEYFYTSGNANVGVTASASLTEYFNAAANTTVVVAASATLIQTTSSANIASNTTVAVIAGASLSEYFYASGNAPVVVTANAMLNQIQNVAGNSAIQVAGSADLTLYYGIAGNAVVLIGASGTLVAVHYIAGNANVNTDATATLALEYQMYANTTIDVIASATIDNGLPTVREQVNLKSQINVGVTKRSVINNAITFDSKINDNVIMISRF